MVLQYVMRSGKHCHFTVMMIVSSNAMTSRNNCAVWVYVDAVVTHDCGITVGERGGGNGVILFLYHLLLGATVSSLIPFFYISHNVD